MKRSSERILTTHSGSLIRPLALVGLMKARSQGQPVDQQQLTDTIRASIVDVVRRQVETGIDIPNDGEFARVGFTSYIHERLAGLEPRAAEPGEALPGAQGERGQFPEFYAQSDQRLRFLWMYPEVDLDDMPAATANRERFRIVGPISYTGQAALQRDLDTLKSALHGLAVEDAFVTAVTPVSRKSDTHILDVYPSHTEYLYALADAMHHEYRAITQAGFVLQLDYAALNPQEQILKSASEPTDNELRTARALGVEMTNHALRGIPEERVRYHHCWGSDNRPHTTDSALVDILPEMLKINAQAYSVEAANPRHEHEWMVWQDIKLPEGKILLPGLVSQSTNVVEHPDLIAWRIKNFASVVGKENIIASVDCGFAQSWDLIRVHPSIQWAKLRSLVEGAARASQDLWPTSGMTRALSSTAS